MVLAGGAMLAGREPVLAQMGTQSVATPVLMGQLKAGQSYGQYQRLTDNHEAVTVHVPSAWSDTETGRWTDRGGDTGVYIAASRDLAVFLQTGQTAGVFVGVSQGLAQTSSVPNLLTREQGLFGSGCRYDGRHAYEDPFYTGAYDTFSQCPGGGNRVVAVALGAGGRHLVLLRMTISSQADLAAAMRILATFQVVDKLDSDHHDD
jgi:serine protease Do